MSKLIRLFASVLALITLSVGPVAAAAPSADQPPKEPARIQIEVAPDGVAAGGSAAVTLRLAAKSGIQINRYPKIKLSVPEQEGLANKAEVSLGDDAPPPADQTGGNYFDAIDPLTLDLQLDPGLAPGEHEFDAKLIYFYCVKKSGFCAPARVAVKIPVSVK